MATDSKTILNFLSKAISKTSNTFRLVIILLIGIIGIIIWTHYSVKIRTIESNKPGQCDYLQKQNETLISVLLEVRKQADSMSRLGAVNRNLSTSFLLPFIIKIDTLPKKKDSFKIKDSLYRKGFIDIVKKIDSAFLKNKKVKKD